MSTPHLGQMVHYRPYPPDVCQVAFVLWDEDDGGLPLQVVNRKLRTTTVMEHITEDPAKHPGTWHWACTDPASPMGEEDDDEDIDPEAYAAWVAAGRPGGDVRGLFPKVSAKRGGIQYGTETAPDGSTILGVADYHQVYEQSPTYNVSDNRQEPLHG